MTHAQLSKNTRYIVRNGKVYCAYCGTKIEPDVEIDHHEETSYYHCDCADAIKELEIIAKIQEKEREIVELRKTLPKIKYRVVKRTVEELEII